MTDLTNSLNERGQTVYAALANNSPLTTELQLPHGRILHSRMKNALDVFSALELARFVEQNEIEIIHAHLARDYTLAAFAAARARNKPRFVFTRHVLFPLSRLHRIFLRRVGGVIAVSGAVADALKQQNLFPAEKIKIIHNGIDIERFTPEIKKPNSVLTVGTIGHLAPIKGQIDFVRAAAIVSQKREDVFFLIVGEDKSRAGENRASIERLIAELNLQTRIRLSGWTDDVREHLSSFALFVSAAREEPFGLVIAEAMACGVPVIATKTEGAREIIEEGVSGEIVPVGNPQSLAQAILDLLDNKEKSSKFVVNGRKRVCENFSLEKMVDETEGFYRRVLAKAVN